MTTPLDQLREKERELWRELQELNALREAKRIEWSGIWEQVEKAEQQERKEYCERLKSTCQG